MERKSTRDGFGEGIAKLGEKNSRVVVVSADLKTSLRLTRFAEAFPDRFFEVGVAEQNMVGVAAGLALTGFVPFACTFGCFSPVLAFGQIRQSVVESGAGVKLVGSHGGVMTGPDGISHQVLEDVSLMLSLPEIAVVVPADDRQAFQATLVLAETLGPTYLRLARPETNRLGGDDFQLGRARVLRPGKTVSLISCGPILGMVLEAAARLEKEDIFAEVIDASSLRPFDEKTMLASVEKTGRVVTIEDHTTRGGLGSVIAAFTARMKPVPVLSLGVDTFQSSSRELGILLANSGLDGNNIYRQVSRFIHHT